MIFEHLYVGMQNVRSTDDLMVAIGVNDKRLITRAVQMERRAGFPIGASCVCGRSGYFLAANQAEAADIVRALRHRGIEILVTAAAIQNAWLADHPGQESLFDDMPNYFAWLANMEKGSDEQQ